jgi:outer membrane protein OmpA-like peptidoglycan-associated protein
MKMPKYRSSVIAAVPIILALAASGCATKKYVIAQVDGVNQRVAKNQTETNAQITALAGKEQTDISRVEERITTTDNKLATVATTADLASASAAQANTAASQALQQAQAGIHLNAEELAKVASLQNYSLSETGNVMFDVNRSELSDVATAGLDAMIQKAAGSPRIIFEVVGFTDKTGQKGYNLVLSQKRAEAVARYLVRQHVPMKDISLIGLGEEQTPEQLAAEVQGMDPNATDTVLRGLARRVRVRLYTASKDGTQASR